MNKFLFVILFSIFSFNAFAQQKGALTSYIKRHELVKLTDTARLPSVIKMEYFFIKNYFLINKLDLQGYYVPVKSIILDNRTYTVPLRHINGLKQLQAIEDKNLQLIKNKKSGQKVKLHVPPIGNVGGKDGSLIINTSNTEIEFIPAT